MPLMMATMTALSPWKSAVLLLMMMMTLQVVPFGSDMSSSIIVVQAVPLSTITPIHGGLFQTRIETNSFKRKTMLDNSKQSSLGVWNEIQRGGGSGSGYRRPHGNDKNGWFYGRSSASSSSPYRSSHISSYNNNNNYGCKNSPIDEAKVFRWLGMAVQGVLDCGATLVPPMITMVSAIVDFYRALPQDAILAQVGLVYCFAGGYYPTLFSAVQAAKHCGAWDTLIQSCQELGNECVKVVKAMRSQTRWDRLERREVWKQQFATVLKTVDPQTINYAVGSLYTTWVAVYMVLEREYARVISMSLTISEWLDNLALWVLEIPLKTFVIVDEDYHKWIPFVIGWITKAMAMSVAWRIQRVLTASTSAVAGGLMFARAVFRMLHKQGIVLMGWKGNDNDDYDDPSSLYSPLDNILGLTVATIGFWTQMEAQYKNNFSFQVPFPINLITWPFDLMERWIQWAITKKESTRFPFKINWPF